MYISEVMAAPETGAEWIELFNDSDEAVDLSGWLLEDVLSSPSVIYRFEDEVIPAQDYLVVELASAKLNNSADGVILRNSTQKIVDEMNYQGSEKGLSWSLASTGFVLSQPTKNQANQLPSPNPKLSSPSPTSQTSPQPSASLTPLTPPSPPTPNLKNLQLTAEYPTPPTPPPLLVSIKPAIPLYPLASVILGGCLLLVLAWYLLKSHEKNRSLSARLDTPDFVG